MRNRSPRAFRLLCAAFLLLITAGSWPAVAQGPTGVIEGVVRDEQGGVLPGVAMTLRNQDTGVTRTQVTEPDGRYSFPALSPGTYVVRAELAGFGTTEAQSLVITIGLALRQDVTMRVQAVAETHDGRRRIAGGGHDESRSVGHRDQGADRNAADQLAPVSLPGAPGPRHHGRRHEVVFCHGQCGRVDDLQRDRQRRRRHDQQLGGRR